MEEDSASNHSAVLASLLSSTAAVSPPCAMVDPLEWRRTVPRPNHSAVLAIRLSSTAAVNNVRPLEWVHQIIQQCSLVVYPALQQCRCLAKWRIHSNGGGQLLCPSFSSAPFLSHPAPSNFAVSNCGSALMEADSAYAHHPAVLATLSSSSALVRLHNT